MERMSVTCERKRMRHMEEDTRGIQQTPLFLSGSEENVIILENIGRDAAVDHLSLQLTRQ